MSYTVSKLKTATECEQAVSLASDRKEDLLYEQTVMGKQQKDQQETSVSIQVSLITVKAEITGTEAALLEIPEGAGKEAMQNKLRRLNDRKENLEERSQKSGNAAYLDAELDAALLSKQLTEIDEFITAINTHKATL